VLPKHPARRVLLGLPQAQEDRRLNNYTALTENLSSSLRQKSAEKFSAPEPGRMLLRLTTQMQEFSLKHLKKSSEIQKTGSGTGQILH
jgi:hypothetical protein